MHYINLIMLLFIYPFTQDKSKGVLFKAMARKDWFYIPLPLDQVRALDDIIKNEGAKYGIIERTDLIRNVLGAFIECYERTGRSIIDARKCISNGNCVLENQNSKGN